MVYQPLRQRRTFSAASIIGQFLPVSPPRFSPKTTISCGLTFYFSFKPQFRICITVSTWLDCFILMSSVQPNSRSFAGIYQRLFIFKIAIFSTALVFGNRSMWLSLLIIWNRANLPTVSRLRSEETSPKSHPLDLRDFIHLVFRQIQILLFLLQQQQQRLPLLSYLEQPITPS